MPKYTYYNGSLTLWRSQWTDTSTDEDGFQIYFRLSGGSISLYQTIPTSLSLTSVSTTNGSTTVTCDSTANLSTNWLISGPNIAPGTFVASVTNATTFVLSAAATGTASGQALSAVSIAQALPSLTSVTTTSGSTTVTCASTANLSTNCPVSGPNIASGTVVASVTNDTTFVLSAAATGSGSGQTVLAYLSYKAANNYTYAINLPVSSANGVNGGFGGYWIDWWVMSYQGTPPGSNNNGLSNSVTYNPWPAQQGLNLSAPSDLTVTASGDGQFHITYNDNSNCESYFELDYKLHTDTTWTGIGLDFGASGGSPTGAMSTDDSGYKTRTVSTDVYLPKYLPSTAYDFQIRAVDYGNNATAFTGTVTATTQAFKGPTTLTATLVGENTFSLSFSNNSTAASGYHFQYRVQGSSTWLESTSSTGVNYGMIDNPYFNNVNSSYFVALNPKTAYEFQVQAYVRGVNDTTTAPVVTSAYSNTATGTTTFNAPSGLTATSVSQTQVNLAWVDNSSIEGGFGIYGRLSGSGSFTALDYVITANVTTYAVTGLSPGTAYDFYVTSAYGTTSGNIESTPGNTVTVATKDAFTSLTYASITYNQPFSYQAVVTTASARSSWNITGLPTGVTFDSSTGVVSGTPTVTGAFLCPMTATFANGWTTNSTLQLRIPHPAAAPLATTTISDQTLASGGNTSFSLTDKFSDPDSESAVRVITNKGTMDFILYNTATPLTVANFLSYVNNPSDTGNYNGSLFHRSVPGFVIQGGAFKVQSAPNNFTQILTTPSPTNEPGIANLRGTVSMAKQPNDPNSATDQFFVSLADNRSILDNQNGGFTVFGRVAGNGMSGVADPIAALPTLSTNTVNIDGNANTGLTSWPLLSGSTMDTTQVVSITSIAPVAVLSYSVTSNTNSAAVTPSISGTDLQISGVAGGQSDVTVTATDLDGNTVSQTFTVTVNQAATFTGGAPSAHGTVGSTYSFSYSSSGFPAPTFSVTTGALPTGLSLSSAGVISGTCTATGTFNGVVTATNTNGNDTQGFSIVVDKATASMVLNGLAQTYDGSPKAVTATTTPAGLTVDIAYGASLSPTPPSDFGSYAVVATVNDANYSGTKSDTLVIAGQSISSWRTQQFTAGQISSGAADNTADPDGDGLTNFEEYALGSNPNTKTPRLSPTYDANGLTLTFTRPKALPGVTYAAESTDNLGSWSPVTLEVITDGPVQTVRARDPLTSGNPNRRFMHLIFGTP